jgi:hypothetical protein
MDGGGDDDACPLSNVVSDKKNQDAPYEHLCHVESFESTLSAIEDRLSPFERAVLKEYLDDQSYRSAAKNITRKYGERCNEKSIDNALLRIRKKAGDMRHECDPDELPLLDC